MRRVTAAAESQVRDESRLPTLRSHFTLVICALLHAFTHAYASMLVPLYLMMVADLRLNGVWQASLVVTVYAAVYNLGSLVAGILSDRFDRKALLAIGLMGNAAAMVGIGLSRQYWLILLLGGCAGIFGTLFHPSAQALAPSHYPRTPGIAIGMMGGGAGLGFFFGPQFAGWRARAAHWHFDHVAQWQKPCVELGLAGLVMGVAVLLVATDPHVHARRLIARRPLPWRIRKLIVGVACILMFRDFAGVAALSLASIYFGRVLRIDVARAGLFIGLITLPSMIVNPAIVFFVSPPKRLMALPIILVVGGIIIATTPLWNGSAALAALIGFQVCQMASYASSDAAMLERVSHEIRGRVVGTFLMIAGTIGALGPWAMGAWTDALGPRARTQAAYFGPFTTLGLCMLVASLAPLLIRKLGEPVGGRPILPAEEISPETMGIGA